MKSEKLAREYEKYFVPSTAEYPLAVKGGSGCYLISYDGKKYLDFHSNVCTAPLGYGHPEILKVLKEKAKLTAYKIAGQDFFCEEALELAKKLRKILPKQLSKILLVNSGAEAVENAMKFAYRKMGVSAGVCFTGAFHGRTLGALSFTESKKVQKEHYPEIDNHIIKFCTSDSDPAINDLKDLLKRVAKPSFVIVEAVQGEGGYKPASKKFLQNLRKLTTENQMPLIIDEVQSGLGRTGKWWAFEHYDIVPDIMSCAKALQVGAAVSKEEFSPKEPGAVSSTWGGGSRIDMAVGAKIIETIEKEKLLKNAEKVGKFLKESFGELMERHKNKIEEVRGLGLMIGVEFKKVEERNKIIQRTFKNRLSILGCGEKTIRIAPPLIITEEEAQKGMDIFEKCLRGL